MVEPGRIFNAHYDWLSEGSTRQRILTTLTVFTQNLTIKEQKVLTLHCNISAPINPDVQGQHYEGGTDKPFPGYFWLEHMTWVRWIQVQHNQANECHVICKNTEVLKDSKRLKNDIRSKNNKDTHQLNETVWSYISFWPKKEKNISGKVGEIWMDSMDLVMEWSRSYIIANVEGNPHLQGIEYLRGWTIVIEPAVQLFRQILWASSYLSV